MPAAQDDNLRAVLDTVFQSSTYDWVQDRDPLAWLRHAWEAFLGWLRAMQAASPLGSRLMAYSAILVVLVIVGHAVWVFIRTLRPATHDAGEPTGAPPPPPDALWFRREAQRHANDGQYRAAIEADFRALLLTLEQRNLLRVHPSTTPAEYARSAEFTPAARQQFEETVRRLYGYLFAQWPCGPDEYAAWHAATDPDRYAATH